MKSNVNLLILRIIIKGSLTLTIGWKQSLVEAEAAHERSLLEAKGEELKQQHADEQHDPGTQRALLPR